ncbi:MAG: leucine--tRNA ligase [Candidatus Saccharimonadales bacterium]
MNRYSPLDIEPKWQKFWDDNGTYVADLNSSKNKYYAMSMFNYPSGNLHIGHSMNFTISDVMARFKRQQGYETYHPVGWDSFGLPAENRAIKEGVSPQESMRQLIPAYHKAYKAMGWSNDWSKEIATHEPEYYKWTQWIFAQMFKAGLAYQDSRMQWWCDIDKTVLSNEQVIDGKCWRHDSPGDPVVAKKEIKQWFFKITDYAEELLGATDALDWTESVKLAQKNWIGKSQGAEIDFKIYQGDILPNVVILHGYTGRSDKNFIPKLKADLEAMGYVVQAPQLPNTDNPVESEQVGYALENCTYDENTIIIGHSLGGAVAMKVVEKLDHPIRDLILVAPVVEAQFRPNDYDRPFLNAFEFTYDYELIKSKTNRRVVLSDTQEHDNRMAYLKYLAPIIDAELVTVTAEKIHFRAVSEPAVLGAIVPSIRVFTTRPDTIFGATFLVVAPEHPELATFVSDSQKAAVQEYIDQTAKKSELERMEDKEKTGVFTGSYSINPANGEKIPIWVADYVLFGYGTGAIMAVPAHDERDQEFAEKFDLPVIQVVDDDENLINSGEFDGQNSSDARENIVAWLEEKGIGQSKTTFKIRDWSVSRQRYWGAPIPIINCPTDGPVLDEDLPVILPELEDFAPSGDGRSALARADDWLHVKCPKCGGNAERETDTLDTYICSSWYFMRYLDPHNDNMPFGKAMVDKWMPVDFYNGGDHATAHMIYARFVTRFLHHQGLIDTPEPFKRFLFNGKVTASNGEMFSKSKGNGVDPLEIIGSGYGADSLRTYLMFAAPLDTWIKWDPQGVPATYRFLNRVWNLVQEFTVAESGSQSESVLKIIHPVIKKVTSDLEDQKYNTAIASMMKLTNDLYELKARDRFADKANWKFALESIVAMVSPFAPHIGEELWHQLGHETSVHRDSWPKWDDMYLISDTLTIVVQVNGKLRATLDISADTVDEDIKKAALEADNVVKFLDGKEPLKVIYIPKKLVNIVIK